jgi:hypothetical protein
MFNPPSIAHEPEILLLHFSVLRVSSSHLPPQGIPGKRLDITKEGKLSLQNAINFKSEHLTVTITKSRAATTPPSGLSLCNVEIQGPRVNPSLKSQGMSCEEFAVNDSFVELYASMISEGSFLSVKSLI